MLSPNYVEALKVIDRAHVRMWYQVELTPLDALQLMEETGSGNLHWMIRSINAALPLCEYGTVNGEPNPNNGKQNHRFAIGRENSRVVYVRFFKTFHEKLGEADWARIRQRLEEIGKVYGCDENSLVEETDTAIEWRYWWD